MSEKKRFWVSKVNGRYDNHLSPSEKAAWMYEMRWTEDEYERKHSGLKEDLKRLGREVVQVELTEVGE